MRVNWSGDPEIAAWGVSMGTTLEYGLSSEGHLERKDRMITTALFVGAELAEAPYEAGPVMHWCDVREREKNSGSWPVKASVPVVAVGRPVGIRPGDCCSSRRTGKADRPVLGPWVSVDLSPRLRRTPVVR
ncbi:hypothetical protein SATRM34S_07123 [Streptomyces atroolivaceus]